jgi:hypothetical protein
MRRSGLIYILFLTLQSSLCNSSFMTAGYIFSIMALPERDTLPDNQILYNGRGWQNLYPDVKDNQFLFTKDFLTGSVTMRGKTFQNLKLRYDIYRDELLTPGVPGGVLQLNKEMVDSFTLIFQAETYQFIKLPGDSLRGPSGYCNLLYNGEHALYARYIKKIGKLADEGKYDKFYQVTSLYVLNNSSFYPVNSRKDLEKISGNKRAEVRNFIRNNKLKISKDNPAGFVHVLRYLDTLR